MGVHALLRHLEFSGLRRRTSRNCRQTRAPCSQTSRARTIGPLSALRASAAGTFEIIGDLLRETDASPTLRATLYQAAAQIPGVTLIGTVTDAAGRSGTAVAYASNGGQDELIFDPTTSVLLGEATVVTDPSQLCRLDVSVGAVISETSYVASGVVNSTSDVPRNSAHLLPRCNPGKPRFFGPGH